MPWVRWPPWSSFIPRIRSPGLDHAEVGGHVGLGARVGLDVDVLGAGEEAAAPARWASVLGDVDELAAAVVALAGQALGVLVRQPAALGLHDGGRRCSSRWRSARSCRAGGGARPPSRPTARGRRRRSGRQASPDLLRDRHRSRLLRCGRRPVGARIASGRARGATAVMPAPLPVPRGAAATPRRAIRRPVGGRLRLVRRDRGRGPARRPPGIAPARRIRGGRPCSRRRSRPGRRGPVRRRGRVATASPSCVDDRRRVARPPARRTRWPTSSAAARPPPRARAARRGRGRAGRSSGARR